MRGGFRASDFSVHSRFAGRVSEGGEGIVTGVWRSIVVQLGRRWGPSV